MACFGQGDFTIGNDGHLTRNTSDGLAYIGGYMVHPRLFSGIKPGKFSMNVLWDKAIARRRLFGVAHTGHWLHVGTPDAIAKAEAFLQGP